MGSNASLRWNASNDCHLPSYVDAVPPLGVPLHPFFRLYDLGLGDVCVICDNLTGGARHDMSQAESPLAPLKFDAVIADNGYDPDPLCELLSACTSIPAIEPPTPCMELLCEAL